MDQLPTQFPQIEDNPLARPVFNNSAITSFTYWTIANLDILYRAFRKLEELNADGCGFSEWIAVQWDIERMRQRKNWGKRDPEAPVPAFLRRQGE